MRHLRHWRRAHTGEEQVSLFLSLAARVKWSDAGGGIISNAVDEVVMLSARDPRLSS